MGRWARAGAPLGLRIEVRHQRRPSLIEGSVIGSQSGTAQSRESQPRVAAGPGVPGRPAGARRPGMDRSGVAPLLGRGEDPRGRDHGLRPGGPGRPAVLRKIIHEPLGIVGGDVPPPRRLPIVAPPGGRRYGHLGRGGWGVPRACAHIFCSSVLQHRTFGRCGFLRSMAPVLCRPTRRFKPTGCLQTTHICTRSVWETGRS
jgi:hypothetical protein